VGRPTFRITHRERGRPETKWKNHVGLGRPSTTEQSEVVGHAVVGPRD